MVTIPKWVVYNIVLSTLERMQRHQLVSVSFDRGDFKGWVMFLTPKTRGMQQPDTRSEPKWAVEKLIFWSRQNFGCVKRGTSPADIHQPLLGWQPGRKHLGEVLRTKTTMPWSALGLIFNTRWPRVVSSMKERLESSQDLLGAGADLRDLLSKLAPYSRILGSCALASAVTNCVPDPNHAERYKASLKAAEAPALAASMLRTNLTSVTQDHVLPIAVAIANEAGNDSQKTIEIALRLSPVISEILTTGQVTDNPKALSHVSILLLQCSKFLMKYDDILFFAASVEQAPLSSVPSPGCYWNIIFGDDHLRTAIS